MIARVEPEGLFGLPELVSQVSVASGTLAFVSGQVAWDDQGDVVGVGDHKGQVEQIAERLDRILMSVGAQRTDIVKETIYVVDYRPDLVPVLLGALHGTTPPSSTLVPVDKLFAPEFLVEVEWVIAVPSRSFT